MERIEVMNCKFLFGLRVGLQGDSQALLEAVTQEQVTDPSLSMQYNHNIVTSVDALLGQKQA
jgi:hypothetical protein